MSGTRIAGTPDPPQAGENAGSTNGKSKKIAPEGELHLFLDNAAICVHWVDAEGIITWANKAELNLLGYKEEEYVGHNISEFHIDQPAIRDILHRLANNETLDQYEAKLRRKDGSIRIVHINSNVLFENGKFIHTRCFTNDVTEQKRLHESLLHNEELLKKSEATLRTILENTNDSYVLYGKDTRVLEFNDIAKEQYLAIHGTVLEIGKSVYDLTPPDHHAFAEEVFNRCLGGETFEVKVNRKAKDETERWFKNSYYPVKSSAGEVIGISIRTSEITEEVKILSAIEKSEATMRALFNNSKDGLVLIDPHAKILAFNRNAAELYRRVIGKTLMIGKSVYEVLAPELRSYMEVAFTKVLAGESLERRSKHLGIDGKGYWIEGFYNPVRSENGTVVGICMGVADVTEEVAANAVVAELAAIVQSSDDAIIGKTLEGIVTSWNAGAQRIFGYTPEEMIGQSITKLIPKDRLNEEPRILELLKKGKRVEHFTTIRITKEGKPVDISLTISPIKNSDGTVIGASKIARDITEQKHFSDQLRESEERFRTIADTAPILIWMTDEHKKCDFLNKGWLEFTGRTQEELGNRWTESVHPDDLPESTENFINAFDERKEFTMEYRLLRFDGEYRWVSDNGVPRYSPDGTFSGYIGTCSDITDRKNAREELEKKVKQRTVELQDRNESLERQKNFIETVLDSSVDQICVYDMESRFLGVNKRFTEMSGLHADEMLGKTFLEIFPSLKDSLIYKGLHQALQGIIPDTFTWKSPNTEHFYSIYCIPLIEGKKVYGAIVIAHDDTAMIEASEKLLQFNQSLEEKNDALQQQKDLVETMIDSSVDFIGVYDKDVRLISLNKKTLDFMGLKKEDIVGKTFWEINKDNPGAQAQYDDIQSAMRGDTIHRVYPRSAESFGRDYELFYIPLRHNNGVYAVLGMAHDVTEVMNISEKLRKANEDLEEKNKALERSNSDLERFAYVASHDLQEPLRKIRTFTGLIQEAIAKPNDAVEPYLNKIVKSSDRMSELIKDILNYSRISNAEEHFVPTDLNKVVEAVISDFDLVIEEKKAKIVIDSLPTIEAIGLQMNQLFYNLIGNSLKFASDGVAPEIHISSKLLSPEDAEKKNLNKNIPHYDITVKDNGIGFDQKFAEKIFVLFQRLNERQKFEGTGIGLALCRKIVTMHCGEIHATSKEGEGTEFHIILPAKHVSKTSS